MVVAGIGYSVVAEPVADIGHGAVVVEAVNDTEYMAARGAPAEAFDNAHAEDEPAVIVTVFVEHAGILVAAAEA